MSGAPSDPRGFLALAWIYRCFNWTIGADASFATIAREHVRPLAGWRILDVGCGLGSLLPFLRGAEYVGFDLSPRYVSAARALHGSRGRFVCADLATVSPDELGRFDAVVSYGVLHHLDEAIAERFFYVAWSCLKTGGRLTTCDGVFAEGQPRLVRWLLEHDRGRHVRAESEYVRLASERFSDVRSVRRTDLLRIPYTHLVMECTK